MGPVVLDARMAYYSPGGIGRYVKGLLWGFEVAGLKVVPAWARRDRTMPGPRLFTPPHHPLDSWLVGLELMRLRPALVHSPDFIPPFTGRFRRVITVHDLAYLRWPEILTPEAARYYRQVFRAVRVADRIIAVSRRTAADLVELAGADRTKVEVVYEAPMPDFRPLNAGVVRGWLQQVGLEPGYLLYVGTIEPRKDLPTLARAYRLLLGRYSGRVPPLVIAGGRGWLWAESVEALESVRPPSQVRWLGPVAPGELVYLYNGAVALVLPSLYEGFGLVAVEAMACGLPVVCSDGGALPEVTGEAARRFPVGDAEALAEALAEVVFDPDLRRRLAERGLARAAEFSWVEAARQTFKIYTDVLA
ncbi:MAG: glycosyltransferase family 1 protein [Chloroflexota bacterium]